MNDDLTMIAGQRDRLLGRIQERYGVARDEVERQLGEWQRARSAADAEASR